MEPEGSWPHSQEPVTNPVLTEINPVYATIPLPEIQFVLYSHLRLGLQRGFFLSGFHTETLYAPLLSHIRVMYPVHLIFIHVLMIYIYICVCVCVCVCVYV